MRTNRRRTMMLIGGQYERIEYIESNGSSYIDTGIYGSDSLDIEILIHNTYKNILFFIASRKSPMELTYTIVGDTNYSQTIRFDYCDKLNVIGYYKRVTIRKSGLDLYVNDVFSNKLPENKFTTPSTLLMFGILKGSIVNAAPAGGKIYFLKMKENGVLVRDFVPAKRKSDGMIGMYDLVGRKFYTSPNGVSFTGGDKI